MPNNMTDAMMLLLNPTRRWRQRGDRMKGPRYASIQIERIHSKRMSLGQYVLVVAGMVGLTLSPAMAADANRGAELAKRWCASCHVVDNGQKQASADVPPFAAIASKPDFSAEKLAFFLLDPHPKMPSFPLSRNEAGDIAAFIAALRK